MKRGWFSSRQEWEVPTRIWELATVPLVLDCLLRAWTLRPGIRLPWPLAVYSSRLPSSTLAIPFLREQLIQHSSRHIERTRDVPRPGDLADASRTDMEGEDASGVMRVILENKFWAGLTPNQPGAYLRRLPAAHGLWPLWCRRSVSRRSSSNSLIVRRPTGWGARLPACRCKPRGGSGRRRGASLGSRYIVGHHQRRRSRTASNVASAADTTVHPVGRVRHHVGPYRC